MTTTPEIQKKSPFPISSILFFLYAIVYTLLTFSSTIGDIQNAVNNYEQIIEYGNYSIFIAPLDNIIFTFGILLLAVLPLCKVRGFLLALPLGMFLIHANASFISMLADIGASAAKYGSEILESNISNLLSAFTSAAVLSFALFLMIIAALLSSKKRKPVLPIIASVFFFINFVTYIINVITNLTKYGEYGYTVNATVIGYAFLHLLLIVAMLLFGIWMAHGKSPKAPKAPNAEAVPTFTVPMPEPEPQPMIDYDATVVLQPEMPNIPANTSPDTAQFDNAVDEIKRYKELLDIGAITEEEFNEKKKQLLGF